MTSRALVPRVRNLDAAEDARKRNLDAALDARKRNLHSPARPAPIKHLQALRTLACARPRRSSASTQAHPPRTRDCPEYLPEYVRWFTEIAPGNAHNEVARVQQLILALLLLPVGCLHVALEAVLGPAVELHYNREVTKLEVDSTNERTVVTGHHELGRHGDVSMLKDQSRPTLARAFRRGISQLGHASRDRDPRFPWHALDPGRQLAIRDHLLVERLICDYDGRLEWQDKCRVENGSKWGCNNQVGP